MSSPANPVTSDRSLEFPVDNGEARIGEPPFRQVLVRKFSRRVGYRQRLVMSLCSDGRSGGRAAIISDKYATFSYPWYKTGQS